MHNVGSDANPPDDMGRHSLLSQASNEAEAHLRLAVENAGATAFLTSFHL